MSKTLLMIASDCYRVFSHPVLLLASGEQKWGRGHGTGPRASIIEVGIQKTVSIYRQIWLVKGVFKCRSWPRLYASNIKKKLAPGIRLVKKLAPGLHLIKKLAPGMHLIKKSWPRASI